MILRKRLRFTIHSYPYAHTHTLVIFFWILQQAISLSENTKEHVNIWQNVILVLVRNTLTLLLCQQCIVGQFQSIKQYSFVFLSVILIRYTYSCNQQQLLPIIIIQYIDVYCVRCAAVGTKRGKMPKSYVSRIFFLFTPSPLHIYSLTLSTPRCLWKHASAAWYRDDD